MKKTIIAILLVLLTLGLCVSCNGDAMAELMNGDALWYGGVMDGFPFPCIITHYNNSYEFYFLYPVMGSPLMMRVATGIEKDGIVVFSDEETTFSFNPSKNYLVNEGVTANFKKYKATFNMQAGITMIFGEIPIPYFGICRIEGEEVKDYAGDVVNSFYMVDAGDVM